MNQIVKNLLIAGMLALPLPASATLLISDLDLSGLSFEVDALTPPTTTGTSNGIGFTLTGNYYTPFSNTTGIQSYNDLPDSYDDLHLGRDFTITFAQEIDYLLVALANDNNTGDGPDFGLTPSDSRDISLAGTQTAITDIQGALLLFDFASPTTSISHVNTNRLDGFDVSFFAGVTTTPPKPVPTPTPLVLLGLGLACLGWSRRK